MCKEADQTQNNDDNTKYVVPERLPEPCQYIPLAPGSLVPPKHDIAPPSEIDIKSYGVFTNLEMSDNAAAH